VPPLVVSVWDSQARMTLTQARAPGGNAVAATLAVLRGLVLKGCTVTADALHCHPKMAEAVLEAKAHYALALKANNGPLHAAAEQALAQVGTAVPSYSCEERGHGRSEWRQASVIPATSLVRPATLPGLTAVGSEHLAGAPVGPVNEPEVFRAMTSEEFFFELFAYMR